MQTAIAKFCKAGHWVQCSEVEVLSPSGLFVEERRYIVFSKAPGKPLRDFLYEGVDAKRCALDQFEWAKSVIGINH